MASSSFSRPLHRTTIDLLTGGNHAGTTRILTLHFSGQKRALTTGTKFDTTTKCYAIGLFKITERGFGRAANVC